MNHFTVKKNGGEVDYQYGEWLKAFNGRLRSPPQDSGAKNNQPSSTWELRRFVSQGVDRPQYVDNPEVQVANMDTQCKGINSKFQ